MDEAALRDILEQLRQGRIDVDGALRRVAPPLTARLPYAALDLERRARTGDPEIVFGQGKETEQIAGILLRLAEAGQDGLVTRLEPERAEAVARLVRASLEPLELHIHPRARLLHLRVQPPPTPIGLVAVVCAGTSDLPVADEAALVAEALGARVERHADLGVAGLHRILGRIEDIRRARVVIVAAGMEGALASVVAGLVAAPVIAVPTSVGYGASLGGVAALLGMLNSCAAGVSVVNIDNGFGAALQAVRINRLGQEAG